MMTEYALCETDEEICAMGGERDGERLNAAMVPLLLQALSGTSVVVVAVVVLLIVLLVWVWMRGGEAQEAADTPEQLEEGERPSSDILDQREEVDEEAEVDEDMSLAEVKKQKMAKVKDKEAKQKEKERRKAGAATKEAKQDHEESTEDQLEEAGEKTESGDQEPESEDSKAGDEADDDEKQEEPSIKEPESGGIGIPDPSDAGLVDESGAEEQDAENDERERKSSNISVPTPDDVSEADIGTSPDDEADAADTDDQDEGAPDEKQEDTTDEQKQADAEEAESDVSSSGEVQAKPDQEQQREQSDEQDGQDEQQQKAETASDDDQGDGETKSADDESEEAEQPDQQDDEPDEPKTLEEGLEKTREGLIDRLSSLFTGDSLDDEIVEDVEEILIKADVGPKVTRKVIEAIEEQLEGEDKNDPKKVWGFIRHYTEELLQAHEGPLEIDSDSPFVILVVGVNGVGKTTTIGKMASKFKNQGKSVLLVAGDTFRAAAVDQLGIWAERTDLPMHTGDEGADPASVIYSGIERGIDEDIDVVICDTSGRLHTDKNLMEELKKMERVAGNAKEGAPHEVNLVLDANTGQNAIAQAEKFFEALDVSGLTLTKFDGTARGGVILGVCDRFDAPVRYVGIGERVADLREFDAEEFVEALFM